MKKESMKPKQPNTNDKKPLKNNTISIKDKELLEYVLRKLQDKE
ncbi:MAG: hypothetical protein N4A46_14870 [Schleiferiaceae bacterium]|jgi:hypothetical protein|nr:hypothetical protein [Schleiferiaceae bacterium]